MTVYHRLGGRVSASLNSMFISYLKIHYTTKTVAFDCLYTRLLARWESRSPMDGHFSEKINMNNCIQNFF